MPSTIPYKGYRLFISMEYLDKLSEYNNVDGSIVDTTFTNSRKYIDLVLNAKIKSRNYFIINKYESKPWHFAYDFTNSIKNELRKKSGLIKESLNEKHLNLLKGYAIVILNAEDNDLGIIRIAFDNLKEGGAVIVRTNNSSDDVLKNLSTKFTRSLLELNTGFIVIQKSNEVNVSSIVKRTNSKLT